jgi:hypothetical protein
LQISSEASAADVLSQDGGVLLKGRAEPEIPFLFHIRDKLKKKYP